MRILTALIVVLLLLSDAASACTTVVVGLRKEFRSSSQIFVGELIAFENLGQPPLPSRLAEKWKSLERVTFRIEKSWKGQGSGDVSLYLNPVCDCPNRDLFPVLDQKMLVFADKDGVVDACDLYVTEIDNKRFKAQTDRVTKKLDSFWFRTWARVYPF